MAAENGDKGGEESEFARVQQRSPEGGGCRGTAGLFSSSLPGISMNVSTNSSGPVPKTTPLLPVAGLGSSQQAGCRRRSQQPSQISRLLMRNGTFFRDEQKRVMRMLTTTASISRTCYRRDVVCLIRYLLVTKVAIWKLKSLI